MMLNVGLRALNLGLDPREVRKIFPIFANNPGLVFLDTAASAQKPNVVIDGVAAYYRSNYANVHRGAYGLSVRSTARFEEARATVRRFINAGDASEIVFVRGATEGINLVAHSWGGTFLKAGDQVLISELEHHANIVPWQLLRERTGIELVVTPIAADGSFDLAAFRKRITARTKLIAITQIANVTGHVTPVEEIVRLGHAAGAKILIDGCQAAPRLRVDMQTLDCDFYVFSGHKCYGPTGIGVLYGKRELLNAMPPWQGGGDMILTVAYEKTTYQDPPQRFEAGTPDISGAIGLDLALRFMESVGLDAIYDHEVILTRYAVGMLSSMPGVHVVKSGGNGLGVVSFTVDGIHPHDLATILDDRKVAIRAGHHCAQPLMEKLGLPATARASFGIYNDESDVDVLVAAIESAQAIFGT